MTVVGWTATAVSGASYRCHFNRSGPQLLSLEQLVT